MAIATRFTEVFGCRHPLQQAGLGGMTSPALAIAVAGAGGLGMLTGSIGQIGLSEQLDAVPAGAAIGVNFLVPWITGGSLWHLRATCAWTLRTSGRRRAEFEHGAWLGTVGRGRNGP
jgi:nitronate monooxygenase